MVKNGHQHHWHLKGDNSLERLVSGREKKYVILTFIIHYRKFKTFNS